MSKINGKFNENVPSWMKLQYFENILRQNEPNYKNTIDFQIRAAVPPGENFSSNLWRIVMKFEMNDDSAKEKSLILKTMLADTQGGVQNRNETFFTKELEMYKTYIPAFEQLYTNIGRNVQFAPKCLYAEHKDNNINFVFEDLNEKNFQNIDRIKGCDMRHMEVTLRKLAEYHAASARYEELHGPYPEEFQKGFILSREESFNIKTTAYKRAMLQWDMNNTEDILKKFPTYQQYRNSFNATLDHSTNSFKVLTHGDFWSSNIMFNYFNNEKINDILFIDYQICKWGSPVEDLLFFITISAAKDIRIKEFNHFIAIYHDRLIECLQLLNYQRPLPKLRDLLRDIFDKRYSFFAFFAIINHLVIVSLPSDVDSNIQTFSRNDKYGDDFRMRAYTNPIFVESAKELFPFFCNRGLFNFEDYE